MELTCYYVFVVERNSKDQHSKAQRRKAVKNIFVCLSSARSTQTCRRSIYSRMLSLLDVVIITARSEWQVDVSHVSTKWTCHMLARGRSVMSQNERLVTYWHEVSVSHVSAERSCHMLARIRCVTCQHAVSVSHVSAQRAYHMLAHGDRVTC